MADRKISDLTALTAPAAGDFLPIVDISEVSAASKNKRITIEELLRGAPDGIAAAPSIAFESDPNTGIFSPGADQLSISTGGTQRLLIDSTGAVGIGTGNPAVLLHGTTSVSATTEYAGVAFLENSFNNYDTAPTTAYPVLKLSRAGKSGFSFRSAAQFGIARYENVSVAGRTRLDIGLVHGEFAAPDATVMSLLSSGAVGIGNTSPGEALDVNGNIRMSAVPGTNTNAALPVLFQASTGTVDGGSSLTFNPGGDVLSVNGLTLAASGVSGSGNLGTFTCANGSGQFDFRATNDSLRFIGGSSEAARFDGSGKLLVGTSTARSNIKFKTNTVNAYVQQESSGSQYSGQSLISYSSGDYNPVLTLGISNSNTLGTNALVGSDFDLGMLQFVGNDGTDFKSAAVITATVDGTAASGSMPGILSFATSASGSVSPTERMRISSNGGTTISSDGITSGCNIANTNTSLTADILQVSSYRNTTSSTYNFIACIRQGFAYALFVRDSGNVENANNSYGGISDIKLKENIVDANSQWDDLKALQVRNYNFKEETGHPTYTQIGLVAQEVELVSPGLVSESPDRDEEGNDLGTVTKSVNYSVLYMKAVKALQEAMERIETFEQRLTDAGIA